MPHQIHTPTTLLHQPQRPDWTYMYISMQLMLSCSKPGCLCVPAQQNHNLVLSHSVYGKQDTIFPHHMSHRARTRKLETAVIAQLYPPLYPCQSPWCMASKTPQHHIPAIPSLNKTRKSWDSWQMYPLHCPCQSPWCKTPRNHIPVTPSQNKTA
jgi:hypothetical protein